jgi:SSS family solute:Na+ symporter
VFGLFLRRLQAWPLLLGWAVGMIVGTLMAFAQSFSSIYPLPIAGLLVPGYTAFWAFLANLLVCVAASVVLVLWRAVRVRERAGLPTAQPLSEPHG